jgi:hypothetical protein
VKKVADPEIFNQSTGKSVSYAHVARVGQEQNTVKAYPCFISLLKDNLVDSSSFLIATILVIKQLLTLSFRNQGYLSTTREFTRRRLEE